MQVAPRSLRLRYSVSGAAPARTACTAMHTFGRIAPGTVRWEPPWNVSGFGGEEYADALLRAVQDTLHGGRAPD